jgi:CTD nuclear envelope phosphatase 1
MSLLLLLMLMSILVAVGAACRWGRRGDGRDGGEGYGGRPRWVLALDLDETLGHYVQGTGTFVTRPHLRAFLLAVARRFDEVVVFTAGTREYAQPIVDAFDPVVAPDGRRLLRRRFYRDACTLLPDGRLVKDLRVLGERDLGRVLLLDNTPSAYALQPQCGVPIASFYGDDPDDAALPAAVAALDGAIRAREALAQPPIRPPTKPGPRGEGGGRLE